MRDRWRSALAHRKLKLAAQDIYGAFDARLSE
jgi:hypothetical protein